MLMTMECKYFAPCGLCTFYNRPCSDMCRKKGCKPSDSTYDNIGNPALKNVDIDKFVNPVTSK